MLFEIRTIVFYSSFVSLLLLPPYNAANEEWIKVLARWLTTNFARDGISAQELSDIFRYAHRTIDLQLVLDNPDVSSERQPSFAELYTRDPQSERTQRNRRAALAYAREFRELTGRVLYGDRYPRLIEEQAVNFPSDRTYSELEARIPRLPNANSRWSVFGNILASLRAMYYTLNERNAIQRFPTLRYNSVDDTIETSPLVIVSESQSCVASALNSSIPTPYYVERLMSSGESKRRKRPLLFENNLDKDLQWNHIIPNSVLVRLEAITREAFQGLHNLNFRLSQSVQRIMNLEMRNIFRNIIAQHFTYGLTQFVEFWTTTPIQQSQWLDNAIAWSPGNIFYSPPPKRGKDPGNQFDEDAQYFVDRPLFTTLENLYHNMLVAIARWDSFREQHKRDSLDNEDFYFDILFEISELRRQFLEATVRVSPKKYNKGDWKIYKTGAVVNKDNFQHPSTPRPAPSSPPKSSLGSCFASSQTRAKRNVNLNNGLTSTYNDYCYFSGVVKASKRRGFVLYDEWLFSQTYLRPRLQALRNAFRTSSNDQTVAESYNFELALLETSSKRWQSNEQVDSETECRAVKQLNKNALRDFQRSKAILDTWFSTEGGSRNKSLICPTLLLQNAFSDNLSTNELISECFSLPPSSSKLTQTTQPPTTTASPEDCGWLKKVIWGCNPHVHDELRRRRQVSN